jgi:predicted nucleic acid-binding Zn ribbon protein
MANYEYECPAEKEIITISRPMSEPEKDYFCGVCGAQLKRIYNAAPVKFNATGFYSTGG